MKEFINKYITRGDSELTDKIYKYIMESYILEEESVFIALKENMNIKEHEEYKDLKYSNPFIKEINVSSTNKDYIGIRFYLNI